ncbi:hypothetical protein FHS85_000968 [Rhodoligotrophos appendicifer]|uniref:amino acid synthesis family protein n=1 Tax=Rhodoligotrophos appendicifer TaxID=987056 RepID=UPI0011814F0A|nr:amino acid synthesis family protein [Rhodoligotrophos appendicifer]
MQLKIRRQFTFIEDRSEDFGRASDRPLRKIAVVAVVENPFVGTYVADLSPLIEASAALATTMAQRALAAMGDVPVQSYGKGGIVGIGGEQEHANALLTTAFAEPFRSSLGGGKAWISSMTKVAGPGAPIDIPMNHKDDVYVRSHYDGMSLTMPDTPLPDEVAVIFCMASGGRLNARVGGLTHEEVAARR